MHVLVGGMPANDDVSTDVWQYRQSMPSSSDVVQVAELNRLLDVLVGAGDVGGAPEHHGEQDETRRPATSAPTRLTLERVLALRWKICGIVG